MGTTQLPEQLNFNSMN